MGPGPWHRPAAAARDAAGTGPGEHPKTGRETQKQAALDDFDNPREGKERQTLLEGGMRPADAEHSRMWKALGSGEKAGCEGGGHDPHRAGTGASGCRAGQLWSHPTQTAAKQTTGRMQFSGIPPAAASPSQAGAPENLASSPGARQNQLQRTKKPAAAEPKETGSERRDRNRREDRKVWLRPEMCCRGLGYSLFGFSSDVMPAGSPGRVFSRLWPQ